MSDVIVLKEKTPPLLEGYVGNLTTEQAAKLATVWEKFFGYCGAAEGKGASKKGGDLDGLGSGDVKDAGIPKGDEAKDLLKQKTETAALNALIEEYGGPALRRAFWEFVKMDNPDTAMLRFLRARKWDVDRGIAMLATCLKWRLDNNVEELAQAGDLGNQVHPKFIEQCRSSKTYALGTAVNDMPICYIHVRKHTITGQPGASLQKFVIYCMESFRLLIIPPNDKVVLFFDLTGFGLKNADISCVLFIFKCLEAYYPESLGRLYIYNPPFIFWAIHKMLNPLLDPVVRAKIIIAKKPADVAELVPSERLVNVMGGICTNNFTFIEPKQGENDSVKDEAKRKSTFDDLMVAAEEYETATKAWVKAPTDKALQDKRMGISKKLRLANFEREPYVRGRTIYHRDGTLKPGKAAGIVSWVYKQPKGEIRHVIGRKYCRATVEREIAELAEGKSLDEVDAKTDKALLDEDWASLYGSEELAKEVEGEATAETLN